MSNICNISEDTIARYVTGDLTGVEADKFSAHIQTCEVCRNEALVLRKTLSSVRQAYSEDSLMKLADALEGEGRNKFESKATVKLVLTKDRMKAIEAAKEEWSLNTASTAITINDLTEPNSLATNNDMVKEDDSKSIKSKSTIRPALDPDITPVYISRKIRLDAAKNDPTDSLKRTTMKVKLPFKISAWTQFKTNWYKPLAMTFSCACIAAFGLYVKEFGFIMEDVTKNRPLTMISSSSQKIRKTKSTTTDSKPLPAIETTASPADEIQEDLATPSAPSTSLSAQNKMKDVKTTASQKGGSIASRSAGSFTIADSLNLQAMSDSSDLQTISDSSIDVYAVPLKERVIKSEMRREVPEKKIMAEELPKPSKRKSDIFYLDSFENLTIEERRSRLTNIAQAIISGEINRDNIIDLQKTIDLQKESFKLYPLITDSYQKEEFRKLIEKALGILKSSGTKLNK